MLNFQSATFKAAYGTGAGLPESDRPEVVFCGRSNVGKSSLINKTVGRKGLARTSSEPGKTATVNFYSVDGIYLVDLPGYGYAKKSHSEKNRFNDLMDGFFGGDRDVRLVFSLMDVRHAPSKEDIALVRFFLETETPFCIVLTKADKLSQKQLSECIAVFGETVPQFSDIVHVVTSSETGLGIETLREYIEDVTADGEGE